MRYASVCDGIGAAHVAWQPLGWECAWTSEIEPFPAAVVDHHWKLKNLGDMTAITEEMLHDAGDVQLLVGGTPCQSFSVAGLRGGLADPRGNLALRFVQLAGVMRPEWVAWENVPGVLSSNGGRDFGTFLGALAELGYGFAYRVLDAQWFGVAQRRRRVFVVGHLGDWRRAAAVLFERESVFGNPPTRGKTWERVARSTAASLTSSGRGDERCGESRGQDDVVLAGPLWRGGDQANSEHCYDHAGTLNCDKGQPGGVVCFHPTQDPISSESGLTHALGTGSSGGCATEAVAFTKSKRAQSVTDDEPWVPGDVSPTMSCFDQGDTRATTVVAQGFAYSGYSYKPAWMTGGRTDCLPASGHSDGSHQGVGVVQPVAFDTYSQSVGDVTQTLQDPNGTFGDALPAVAIAYGNEDTAGTVRSNTRNNSSPATEAAMHVMHGMAVRRLTPRECERLQGFPDDFTLVTYRGKPAADGPRYRALGNSMAVPVMAWIGRRIAQVEATNG